jgi:hypothetical protein
VARDSFERLREVRPLDALLGSLVDLHGVDDAMRAHRIVLEWHTLVGATVARVTSPDGLRRGVLSVWVKTSPWMQELRLLKDKIIGDINAGIGGAPLVTDLRLHFGAARLHGLDDHVAQLRAWLALRQRPARRSPRPAVGDRRSRIECETAVIDDPDLRAVVSQVRTRWDR